MGVNYTINLVRTDLKWWIPIWIFAGVVAGFSAVALVPVASSSDGSAPWVALVLESAVCLYPLYSAIIRGRAFTAPILLWNLMWWFFFVLRPWIILTKGTYGLITMLGGTPQDVVPAIYVSFAGIVAFNVGYYFSRGLSEKRDYPDGVPLLSTRDIRRVQLLVGAFALLILSIYLRYFLHRDTSSLVGSTAYVYNSFMLLGPLTVIMLWIKLNYPSKGTSLMFWVLLCLSIWLMGTTTSRSTLIFLFGSLWVVLYWKHHSLIGRWRVLIIPILFIGIIIMSYVGVLRGDGFSTFTFADLRSYPPLSAALTRLTSSSGDMNIFDTFSVYLQKNATIPRFWGSEFLDLLLQPIPRALWPGKPLLFSQVYMADLFPWLWVKHIGFSASIMADWIMNFGPVGLVPMMVGSGAVVGYVYRRFSTSVWYAAVFASMANYTRGELIGVSVWAFTYIIPLMIFQSFLNRRTD